MLKKLTSTESLVTYILQECPEARDSDMKLYLIVCETLNPRVMRLSFKNVLNNLHILGLPPFETVRRARQKAQAKNPELKPCDTVALFRAENETAYEKFAIGGC